MRASVYEHLCHLLTLVYPEPLPAAVNFWKFGPATPGASSSTWFPWAGATLSTDRRTVVYTLADNGVGDGDATVGRIRDPFVPALGSDPASIPANNPWAMAVLAALLGWLGLRRQRPRGA